MYRGNAGQVRRTHQHIHILFLFLSLARAQNRYTRETRALALRLTYTTTHPHTHPHPGARDAPTRSTPVVETYTAVAPAEKLLLYLAMTAWPSLVVCVAPLTYSPQCVAVEHAVEVRALANIVGAT